MSTNTILSTHNIDIDQELEHLDSSLSPLNSTTSEILEAALPTILDPPHPNLIQTIVNEPCEDSSSSQIPPAPYANALKSPRSVTPPDSLQVTINNDATPPKERYDMMQDPVFLNSGLMPPILQPLKTPSKMTNVPDDYIHTHLEFKPNVPALNLTSTDYKFQILLDRTTNHYVSYASRKLPQLQYWQEKKSKFFFIQYNFLKSTAVDLG